MSSTAHNQFFGWIHSFKVNRNNAIFNPSQTTQKPFPVIVQEPTFGQALANWNKADTGVLLTTFSFGLIASKYIADSQFITSILRRRAYYKRFTNLFLLTGIYFGLINSTNRLQGHVPNGLPKKRTTQVLKYDYSSQFLSQTWWKYVFSGRSKPSNQ